MLGTGAVYPNHMSHAAQVAVAQLRRATRRGAQPLLAVRSVFPFDPFPAELIVDLNKVTIRDRMFFASAYTNTIAIQDIMMVKVAAGPFFATVQIVPRLLQEEPMEIHYVRVGEARKVRRLIGGLMVAHREKVDLERISREELLRDLDKLGAAEVRG